MGLKEMLTGTDIRRGLQEYRETPGAVLVDVRTADEYAKGHIPGSIHVQNIIAIEQAVPDKTAKVYVYCLSGARSRRAANFFRKIGYQNVSDIGGIAGYSGELER